MRTLSENDRELFANKLGAEISHLGMRHTWMAFAGAMLLGMAAPSVSVAQQRPLGSGTVMQAVEGLKRGEFLWAPELSPRGPVLVVVSLATQRAVAYRNGVPIGVSTASTGKKGYETPTGVFTILQKHVVHKSNRYSDAVHAASDLDRHRASCRELAGLSCISRVHPPSVAVRQTALWHYQTRADGCYYQ